MTTRYEHSLVLSLPLPADIEVQVHAQGAVCRTGGNTPDSPVKTGLARPRKVPPPIVRSGYSDALHTGSNATKKETTRTAVAVVVP